MVQYFSDNFLLTQHSSFSLCDKKKWYKTQLVLAMPQGYQAKDHVIIQSYDGNSRRVHKILNWVNHNLASRITKIEDYNDLEKNWLHFEKRPRNEKVRIILFSHMEVPPMFFSVLSVKFTGRVKFGTVNANTDAGREILNRLNISNAPAYIVLTPEKTRSFGLDSGDSLNYHSMALLLRTLHPEVNDMFLLSLIIVNMACCLEFFITHGNILKRFGLVLWDIVKWNFLLILLWLPVLGVFQLPYMDYVFAQILSTLRHVSMTGFACYIRDDWLWYSSGGWTFVVSTFFAFSLTAGFLHYLRASPDTVEASPSSTNFWSFEWESYMSSLLQPSLMDGISRTANGHTSYGMDVELLIERLAVPNLWLRPMISSQYVHSLPVWKYTGPCVESDVGSDTESIRFESDGEDGGSGGASDTGRQFGPRPLMFICEKCRALQNVNPAAARKTEQELEAERIESELACATFLMDGDYKCICGQAGGAGGQDHGGGGGGREHAGETGATRSRSSPLRERCKVAAARARGEVDGSDAKKAEVQEPCEPMPPGMIPTLDCSICLESYKFSVLLCGLPCGHTFHQQCIMGWLNRDNHCCPICRWPAYKAKPCNIHQHTE